MQGRMQAIIMASSLALLSLLLPPISIVSSASVALVTLRRGANEGLYVLLFSCLSAALLGLLLFGSFQFALVYGAVLWLPVWVIAIILRESKQLSTAVEIAVLFGVIGIIGFYSYIDDPALLWRSILNEMIQPMLASKGKDIPLDEVKRSVQQFSHFMTGGIAAGSVYGLLFGLFLARWWQASLYNPGGFKQEYLQLRVHQKVAIASILTLTLAWLMSGTVAEICWNIVIIFAVLYTFIGTSILHTAFSVMKSKRFMVPFLYITMILIPHMIAIAIIVGLFDTWLDLRSKILNQTGTNRS